MWANEWKTADLVTFTDEILNGKLDFLCQCSHLCQCFSIFCNMFYFYTPWKCQKTKGFLTFPEGIEMEYAVQYWKALQ